MPRCGCSGQCSCRIQAGTGIGVEGVGSANRPYVLDVNGAELTGQGLAWDSLAERLRVRVAGAGLGFDGQGNLINTGGGGDGTGGSGGNPYPLVSDLETRGQDVIGGLHGAGYMIKPAQLRRSYEYGIERGLDLVHIPVRFLHDGTPVVHIAEFMGTDNLSSLSPSDQVQLQDIHRWRITPLEPGMWNPRQAWQPNVSKDPLRAEAWLDTRWHPFAPATGWFGYLEENQYGLSTLDDILRLCAGWVCVVVEMKWPERLEPAGPFKQPTPVSRTDRFLIEVDRIIEKYRMGGSTVVASREVTVPGGTSEVDVFERFYNRGVTCGLWIENQGDVDAYPPGAVPDHVRWIFPHTGVGFDRVAEYAATHPTVPHPVNRQYMRGRVNNAGCLGVLSGDPEYYAGQISSNATLGDYRYRKLMSSFDYDTIDHGMMPPGDEAITQCQVRRRGSHHVGDVNQWFGNTVAFDNGGTYWILQGWMCPLPNPTNYALDLWFGWDPMPTPLTDLYLTLAFGVAYDYDFRSWAPGSVPEEDTGGSGYSFSYGSNGWTSANGWSGTGVASLGPPTQIQSFGSGGRRVRIGVNPKGIRISQWTVDGAWIKDLLTSTTTLATAHRGGYVYFGRAAPPGNGAVGTIGAPTYMPGSGTQYGPQ